MGHRMLPILYLNLGGEMMYIIDQRLIAQEIEPEKSKKGGLESTSMRYLKPVFLYSAE